MSTKIYDKFFDFEEDEEDFFLRNNADDILSLLGVDVNAKLKKQKNDHIKPFDKNVPASFGDKKEGGNALFSTPEEEHVKEPKLETNNEILDPNEKSIVKGKKPFMMTIFGKPGEGKSALAQYVVYEKLQQKAVDYVMVISNSSFNEDWKWLPPKAIKKLWTPELAETIVKFQTKPERGHLLVVLEDPVGSFPWDDKKVLQMIITHRHLNISWIINVQYVNKIPPIYRECATYVAIFRQQTERSKEALFLSYGGDFNDKKHFYSVLQNSTGNYYFLFYEAPFQRWSKTKIDPLDKNVKVNF